MPACRILIFCLENIMLYIELLLQGLIYGCVYATIAVGLTLVYSLLRILHIAPRRCCSPWAPISAFC